MASNLQSYRDLILWQRAKAYAVFIYEQTQDFPLEERYGLTSQLRRAAVSMPSNIAEGWHRRSLKDQLNFLRIAYGSAAELSTQLEISKDLGYLKSDIYEELVKNLDEVMRMTNRILHDLERKTPS